MPTVQRNILVPPFSTRTPFIAKRTKEGKQDPVTATTHDPQSGISYAHTKFFQTVENACNASVQIQVAIPANSAAPGQPGTIAFDSNWLYIAVGQNIWRRAALSAF
jgi:hypothetical protein